MPIANSSIDVTHSKLRGPHPMIEMYLLEQLDALAKYGTLSAASEQLHITQPSMSRAMKKLEDLVGVELFEHRGNRLLLNDYGRVAADYARRILESQEELVSRIRMLERSRRTILVGSCAPGPLFELPSLLASLYPERTISTEIRGEEALLEGLREGVYHLAILVHQPEDPDLCCHPCGSEKLYFMLPKDHPLAGRSALSFADMDGETFLVFSDIGVWDAVHRRAMPHSRFLLQEDCAALQEIVRSSSLPAFATDISLRLRGADEGRVSIPISDEAATMRYWCCCRKDDEKRFVKWFQMLGRRHM